jgi:sugar/nucleoside kinase (ribokinase family)
MSLRLAPMVGADGIPALSTPTVAVCGTLVADVRVRPFDPIDAATEGDIRDVDEVSLAVGGLVGNTGMALARIGLSTLALGRLGDDSIGDVMVAELAQAGMATETLTRDQGTATTTVLVCVDGTGERTFHVSPGVHKLFDAGDMERQWQVLTEADAIIIGYLGGLPTLQQKLPEILARLRRESSALLVLETVHPQRGTRPLLDQCLPFLDVFFPSRREALDLTGASRPIDALEDLARVAGPTVLGVKLGSDGCMLWTGHGAETIPTIPVKAVDATGAGDVFLAGLVAGLVSGRDPRTAGALGNLSASIAVGSVGGAARIPRLAELLMRLEAATAQTA